VQRVFGGRFTQDDDLHALLEAADPVTVPPLYISCGTEEEMLMAANIRFAGTARARGVDVTTDFRPGIHEWGLWDAVIQDVIAWLPRD
jgi:S-formylglutathione hydrolase FrmB